jgi:riboflavin kinase/FMN adenylyltransferase
MQVIRHVSHTVPATRPRIVAAGWFDGVHRGHQQIVGRVIERARVLGGESIVVVGRGQRDDLRLLDLRQQLERLRDAQVEAVVFSRADEVEAAVEQLAPAVRVSARGSGAGAPAGGTLDEVEPVKANGAPISSDAIRAALMRGDLQEAAAMLGRDPSVGGRVVHGFHRGGPLGIPTANLRVRGVQLPPDGVYAVRARVGDEHLRGVANVGFNPTFGNQTRTVETHLLDFNDDLYGRRLDVAFVDRLRGEQKFADVQALVAQIRADIGAARRYFEQHDE